MTSAAFESSLASLPSERVATPQDSAGPGAATPTRIARLLELLDEIDALDLGHVSHGIITTRVVLDEIDSPERACQYKDGSTNYMRETTTPSGRFVWFQTCDPPVEEASC